MGSIREKTRIRFTGDYYSSIGKRKKNDDYVLFEPNIGGCVADGFGGAPMGDAMARLACHAAMEGLSHGLSPVESANRARVEVEKFIGATKSFKSGTTLVVAAPHKDSLVVAWYGDTAFFYQQREERSELVTNLESCSVSSSIGINRKRPDSVEIALGGGTLAICTDGIWKKSDQNEISQTIEQAACTRELAISLTYLHDNDDNATALAINFE